MDSPDVDYHMSSTALHGGTVVSMDWDNAQQRRDTKAANNDLTGCVFRCTVISLYDPV